MNKLNAYDEPDDDLVFLTYEPRKGWTPDKRFNTPRRFRVDVITQEIVPLTEEELADLEWTRKARFALAVTMVGVLFAAVFVGAVIWMLTL